MTIMYLTVAFLLAALAVSGYTRVRGLEFAHGSPVAGAAILFVVALVIDLLAQLTVGTQGWLLTFNDRPFVNAAGITKYPMPSDLLWKIGLGAQVLATLFLVLGIWRLFAAVTMIVPAGRVRAARPAPNPPVATDADTTD